MIHLARIIVHLVSRTEDRMSNELNEDDAASIERVWKEQYGAGAKAAKPAVAAASGT